METRFWVLRLPGYVSPDFDGLIGWQTVARNVLRIDAIKDEALFLSRVPRHAATWSQFALVPTSSSLDLLIPGQNGRDAVLCVDTGSDGGLALPAREWQRWRDEHPQAATTLKAEFTPSDGFYVHEEAWADKLAVGPVELTDVPIAQAGPANAVRWGEKYGGTVGLAAIKRLELVVDGTQGMAYVQARHNRPTPYPHNRLGAVFLPNTTYSNKAVARVIPGSPAYNAGVRDGDILLQLDGFPITSWDEKWLSRLTAAAGTKLQITVERNGKTLTTTAILREILGPSLKNDGRVR